MSGRQPNAVVTITAEYVSVIVSFPQFVSAIIGVLAANKLRCQPCVVLLECFSLSLSHHYFGTGRMWALVLIRDWLSDNILSSEAGRGSRRVMKTVEYRT